MKVRIQFSKHGAMKFIGHLDIMRYFQKAMRRAEIDIAYSAGFSPHQIMSFAAPLGVGLESDGEYMDIEVNSLTTAQDMKERLNHVMAEGMQVLRIKVLPDNVKNAMASVAGAGYLVRFRRGYEPDFDYKKMLEKLKTLDTIPYIKKTKKGEQTLDLKPAIYELTVKEAIQTGDNTDQRDAIYMLVDASSSGNIKPGIVISALYTLAGCRLPEFALEITRTDTYMYADGEQGLIPLWKAGEDF